MNAKSIFLLCLIFTLLSASGCGVLVGNVKPVDEKSDSFGVSDLSKEKPQDWEKLDPSKLDDPSRPAEETASEVSDVVFQSKKSPATISLNSACRPSAQESEIPVDQDLKQLSQMLFLGMTDQTLKQEQMTTIQNAPALESTVRGKINHKEVMIRSVVLRKNHCTYDLVYLAPPKNFPDHETDFAQFVASLRLK